MTQKALAQKAGLRDTYLGDRLRDVQPVNLNDVEALAGAFGMTPLELMRRVEDHVHAQQAAESGEARGPLRTSEGSYTGEQTEADDDMLRDSAPQRRRTENH